MTSADALDLKALDIAGLRERLRTLGPPDFYVTPEELASLLTRIESDAATIAEREAEIEALTKGGAIEVAVRNLNVRHYMDHWEGRTIRAEAEVARLKEAANEILIPHFEESGALNPYSAGEIVGVDRGGQMQLKGSFMTILLRLRSALQPKDPDHAR